jgi:hypothetical protein
MDFAASMKVYPLLTGRSSEGEGLPVNVMHDILLVGELARPRTSGAIPAANWSLQIKTLYCAFR